MDIVAQGIVARINGTQLLTGVDFVARAGEIVGLIGPNGSGKTTLLRILADLRPADSGTVRYGGRSAAAIGARSMARSIAYLAQGEESHGAMRVETVVSLGRLPYRRRFSDSLTAADRAAIERAMAATHVTELRARAVGSLSAGERMRVLLARALAVEAPMLLADEPTTALDPLHQLAVMALLRDTARRGHGVVVVLHDLALAARFCDRLVLLAHGGVLAAGEPGEVLTDAHVASAYRVEVARGIHENCEFLVPWRVTPGDDDGKGTGA